MTLLSVVKDVCAAVGVTVPQSVFSNINGNRTMQEMVSLANEMAQRIAYDTRDWTTMRVFHTINGDGIATDFPLPANFKRLLLTSNIWPSNSQSPMRFIPDSDEWMRRRANNEINSHGEWTKFGNAISIFPVMPVGASASFVYLDKNSIVLASGGVGDTFLSDNDIFWIDERLLKLAMIYQWKAQKGSSYAEDMSTYGDALTVAMGHDQPAPIMIDRKLISASIAYPYPVPT